MYKVFAFLKRNPQLSHDEYRAGHVGYHCGQSRRLKNIRGYLVNIWANAGLDEQLGSLANELQINPPADFLDWWDGFPQVYFDDHASWLDARTVEPNRATADGLVPDPDWSLADSPHLFTPAPDNPNQFQANHLHMLETVVVPVIRPEHKIFKLMHFFKRADHVSDAQWDSEFNDQYLPAVAQLTSLRGCILNYRDADQDAALKGFFADGDWVFSAEASAARTQFCSYFDGAI
ncbi:MAG: hypothetical protein AB8B93_14015, partial [Pseudomonadales bacterium]